MVAVKIVISFMIVILSTYIGIIKSNKLKSREYILREMVTFLGLVENDIRYMMNILPNIYESARQKLSTELKNVMGKIVVDMLKNNETGLIEQSIVNNVSKLDSLNDYDKNVFISTLKSLGKSDLESQISIIENGINILQNQIKEANDTKMKNSKLYKTVGTITGIMIVVIFI